MQVLRGIAALLVVFHHYNGTAISNGFSFSVLENSAIGNIGVDIFFVLSGFIMELTAGGREYVAGDTARFLLRRGVRIFPLYWTLTIFAFGASLALGSGMHTRITSEEFMLSMLLLPANGLDGKAAYVITMAWSLTYELYFYILFAALLRLETGMRLMVLAAIFTMSVVIGLIARPQGLMTQILLSPILFEFLAGCLLAHYLRRGRLMSSAMGAALVALSIGWMLFESDYVPVPDKMRVLAWGFPATMLVYGVVLSVGRGVAAILRPLAYLGDISYSLYLSHFFTLAIFVRLYTTWNATIPVPNWLAAAVLFALCVAVAQLCYKFIEAPAGRMFFRLNWPRYAQVSVQTSPPS